MSKSATIILLLLGTTFFPFDIFDKAEAKKPVFEFDRLANEGFVAFVVQDTPVDDTEPVNQCDCDGSKVMVHGDGHTTPCQCHITGDGVCRCAKAPKGNAKSCTGPECQCGEGCECPNCEHNAGDYFIEEFFEEEDPELFTPPVIEDDPKPEPPVVKDVEKREFQVLYFTADWCSPCRQVKANVFPLLKADGFKISKDVNADIRIVDIEASEANKQLYLKYAALTKKYSIPQFVFVKGEKQEMKSFLSGYTTVETLKKDIETNYEKLKEAT